MYLPRESRRRIEPGERALHANSSVPAWIPQPGRPRCSSLQSETGTITIPSQQQMRASPLQLAYWQQQSCFCRSDAKNTFNTRKCTDEIKKMYGCKKYSPIYILAGQTAVDPDTDYIFSSLYFFFSASGRIKEMTQFFMKNNCIYCSSVILHSQRNSVSPGSSGIRSGSWIRIWILRHRVWYL